MENDPHRQISRREFGQIVGVVGLAAAGAMRYRQESDTRPQTYHNNFPGEQTYHLPPDEVLTSSEFSEQFEPYENPEFRAGSVTLFGIDTSFRFAEGQGVLVDVEEQVAVYTIGHVAVISEFLDAHVVVPGVGMSTLTPERVIYTNQHFRESEPAAYYVFGQENQELLREAANQGKIRINTLYYGQPIDQEIVVVPRFDHQYGKYRFREYDETKNRFLLNSIDPGESLVCKGDSGSPLYRVLRGDQGEEIITEEVYGLLVASATETYTESHGRDCVSSFYARPNN